MGNFDLQYWPRIGTINQLAEVGRVTPCAPSFALQPTVVAAAGAQRTARPTFRFMQGLDAILARFEMMSLRKVSVLLSNVLPTSRRQNQA